ncbi:molybdopterin synthase catalytic subunit MoaE [Proteus cibarius]|uniref:Molybdopterin synthase catalytic subunit n=1 Tax=Proteus terrae subsp. cibarius TaxID=626774 RepID=A0A8I0WT96_9GAMM|nr:MULTISPECIES: molybdopterin synthase catalytic subunit MoaE [Proteus]QHP75764.1 molybdopterin synthase catalytic subunit MoaE [Proteus vulgaris]MBG2915449.1 molybdopterin synthase catalytic subunit MoaE [Proteus terrae subsp. cibarius]MBG3089602.1 molybdopterin synthase catalytic subunit MoaE [Proteus terrae subsp. cibarius]MBG6039724.1 molybdopterin synthase catalytic subunit MoaE [Proteus terrae subsp. cibarius]MCM2365518.1 molybdopterin synthase catalytic subunit MoaE [Proteus sp. FZP209
MSASTRISVQTENFSVGDEYQWLSECDSDGAVVTFTGKVRNHNLGDEVSTLTLEHYPGMTEKALTDIVNEARGRWPLQRVSVIHRVGTLNIGEEIVFVGVTSSHRNSAFESAEFIMDFLKTRAPFWKKEGLSENNDRWVDARQSDYDSAERWE